MTPTRTALVLAVPIALSFATPTALMAQQVIIPVTVTSPVIRAILPIDYERSGFRLVLTIGPDYYFCAKASQYAEFRSPYSGGLEVHPEALRSKLLGVVYGRPEARRSGADIRAIANQVRDQSDRFEKFRTLFGFLPGFVRHYDLSDFEKSSTEYEKVGWWDHGAFTRLRMGQEVSLIPRIACYSADQIDQIISESLRVMEAVAQQLAPPSAAGPAVVPDAIQQQRRP